MDKQEKVKNKMIEIYKDFYNLDLTNEEILNEVPNEYDMDPAPFLEAIQDVFNIESYPDKDNETIKEAIERVTKLWDGKTLNSHPGSDSFDPEDLLE